MNPEKLQNTLNQFWDNEIVPTLTEYIKIPNKSPAFDPDWEKAGHMDRVLDLAKEWAENHRPDNSILHVKRLSNRTPLIIIEIPGERDGNILMYGHLDKQPEMEGWDEGLGPWDPVIKDDKLYGRGGADDGYAMFASLGVVKALKDYPNFNSSLDLKKEKLIYKKYFHIGIAMDTPHGLMVPKIRDADKKDITELGQELKKISKLCKDLKIDKKEFFGGSMTISSLGSIGGSFFTPIINQPEVAILGIGRAETKQVFVGDKYENKIMLPLSLSYDHRVIDGAEGARFCAHLRESLGKDFAYKLAV